MSNFKIEDEELIEYKEKNEDVVVFNNLKINNENKNIRSIYIQDGVVEIDDYAFFEFDNLENIRIPNSINKIGFSAFDKCKKLKYNIYDNAKYLGNKDNPYLVLIKANNTEISSCFIHGDTKIIYENAFSNCKNLEHLVIPNNVKNTGVSIFLGCKNLKTVEFGNGLECVREDSFNYCLKLEKVIFEKNLKVIENNAFKNCANLSILTFFDNLDFIGNQAFQNCNKLTKIIFHNRVKDIGKNIFLGCNDLELEFYGQENQEIFNEKEVSSVFAPFIRLKESKKNRQKFINGYVKNFRNNNFIKENILIEYVKYIKNNKTRFFEILDEDYCYFMIKNKILNLDDVDFLIKKTTQKNQIELTAILLDYKNKNFSNNQIKKQLDKYLFEEKKVTISSLKPLWNIKKLDNGNYEILGYKGNEQEIEIPYEVSNGVVEKIDFSGLNYSSTMKQLNNLKKIIIPEGIKCIGDRAFSDCINLISCIIPNSIEYLGNYAFGFKRNYNYNIYDNAKYLGSIDNPYFILMEVLDQNIKTCLIHNETRFIYDSAFDYCYNLEEITIPNNVLSIGCGAFNECINLRKITFGSKLNLIKQRAFRYCKNLESIVIPKSINEIEEKAFIECLKLKNVLILNEKVIMGKDVFKKCDFLNK